MEHRFDLLAKSVAGAMSRREAFWRVGSSLALGVLAFLGLGSAGQQQPCAACCALACNNLDEPPRGPEMAFCIQHCLETGTAIGPEDISTQCVPVCTGT